MYDTGLLDQFLKSVELAIDSYRSITDGESSIDSRIKGPDRELRKKDLITPEVAKAKPLDRVHPLNFSLINTVYLALGQDISNVRIHTGPFAKELTHRAGADALTSGNNIYFSPGGYNPETEEGKALLMHELQHVIQHRNQSRQVYREDILKAEKEAYNVEGLTGEEGELFDRLKQDSLIFKDPELTEGLDAVEKDLESYGNSEQPKTYRYLSRSGRQHTLTEKEYTTCISIIKKRLSEEFGEEYQFESEDQKIETISKIVGVFNGGGLI